MNILQKLLNCLKDIKLRNYNIMPVLEEDHSNSNIEEFELAILAISTLIEGLSSTSHESDYNFENYLGVIEKAAEQLRRKIALTYFLVEGLNCLDGADDVVQEQVKNLLWSSDAFPFSCLYGDVEDVVQILQVTMVLRWLNDLLPLLRSAVLWQLCNIYGKHYSGECLQQMPHLFTEMIN